MQKIIKKSRPKQVCFLLLQNPLKSVIPPFKFFKGEIFVYSNDSICCFNYDNASRFQVSLYSVLVDIHCNIENVFYSCPAIKPDFCPFIGFVLSLNYCNLNFPWRNFTLKKICFTHIRKNLHNCLFLSSFKMVYA